MSYAPKKRMFRFSGLPSANFDLDLLLIWLLGVGPSPGPLCQPCASVDHCIITCHGPGALALRWAANGFSAALARIHRTM